MAIPGEIALPVLHSLRLDQNVAGIFQPLLPSAADMTRHKGCGSDISAKSCLAAIRSPAMAPTFITRMA